MNRQQSLSRFLLPRSLSYSSWIFTCVYVYLTKIIYYQSRDVIKYWLSLGRNRNSNSLYITLKNCNWLLISHYFEQCQAILCSVELIVPRNEWHSWLIDVWFQRLAIDRSKYLTFLTKTSENLSKVRPFCFEQYAWSSVTCKRERGARIGKSVSHTCVSRPMPDMSCK
jgi:hypothetical protein